MVLRFQVLTWVKPGGLLYLTVPIGADVVAWNLHRRYGAPVAVVATASPHSNPFHPPPPLPCSIQWAGPIRLPLLLEGWDVVSVAACGTAATPILARVTCC